jgi:preprotein translocase subunit SecB
MDKQNAPGIRINDVNLISCHVGNYNEKTEKLSYHLGLTYKDRQIADDQNNLIYFLSFDLMKNIKPAPFEFKCDFCITYEREEHANMTWDEFKDIHALTHVIPYIREFIVNMTSRMLVPTLTIPPVNVFALLDEYATRKVCSQYRIFSEQILFGCFERQRASRHAAEAPAWRVPRQAASRLSERTQIENNHS